MSRFDFYEKTSPIATKKGIKAQSRRGAFAQSWWGKRWIDALESFHDSARLGRGRTYARKGQVISVDIKQGIVKGLVQGSRNTPYEVTIEVETLPMGTWRSIGDALGTQALFISKLLAGEMPTDIEEVFEETNVPLFPRKHSQIKTDCSCPDWSNPCKHVAAVLYLVAEEFDRDPFLIFKLRGIEKKQFLKLIENHQSDTSIDDHVAGWSEEKCSLPSDVSVFYKGVPLGETFSLGEFRAPHAKATLPKSLGKFPFWRGQIPLMETLEGIYGEASQAALQILVNAGETDGDVTGV